MLQKLCTAPIDPMTNFAVQLKDRFLGLVDRVTGCGRGSRDKDVREETSKVPAVQEHVEIRTRDSNVSGGSKPGVN